MPVERQLISRVVAAPEELNVCREAGVQALHFHDPDLSQVWEYVEEHASEYGKGPDAEAIRLEFGDFRFGKPGNPTQYYIDKLLDDHRKFCTKELLQNAVSAAQQPEEEGGGHEAALVLLQEGVVAIEQQTSITEDRATNESEAVFSRLLEIQERGTDMLGIPTGFPTIDSATGGWLPEQLIVVAGPQKAGKSSLLVKMALTAQEADYKVVFVSFEMSNMEQQMRYLSLAASISKFAMTHGQLTKKDWAQLNSTRERVERMVPLYWVHDVRRTTTIGGIEAKIDKYKPDIVFVDGAYMMDSGVKGKTNRDWEALAKLTSDLKRMAQNLKVVVVASTQALESKITKKGIQSSSIGYSSTFSQDADVALGLEKANPQSKRALLRIMDARDAETKDLHIEFDWNKGVLEEDMEWTESDDNGDDAYDELD